MNGGEVRLEENELGLNQEEPCLVMNEREKEKMK